MSLLGPEVHQALTVLLQGLSSSENNVRAQAEDQLYNEWVTGRPDVLLMGLVEQIQESTDPSVRSACPQCVSCGCTD
jgi:importin-5